jgi:voltage-gated potassium channel
MVMKPCFVQDVLAEHREREMREVRVRHESQFVGKTILEADMHEKTGIVMVGIGKQGKLTIDPPRDFVIEAGDIILGIGKKKMN